MSLGTPDLEEAQHELSALREKRIEARERLEELCEREATLYARLFPLHLTRLFADTPTLNHFTFTLRTSEWDDNGPSRGVAMQSIQFEGEDLVRDLDMLDSAFPSTRDPRRHLTDPQLEIAREIATFITRTPLDCMLHLFDLGYEDYATVVARRDGVETMGYYEYLESAR